MTTTILSPLPVQHFVDSNGNALVGGKLFTYAAGTTTKIPTYTDSTGDTPNTDPIILNSRGEANVWLPPQTLYKLILSPSTDTDPPTNPIWTVDNINSSGGGSGGSTTFTTISALRSNTVSAANGSSTAVVQEYASGTFVGGGLFIINPSDSSSSDNGGSIIVDAIGQRWYRETYSTYHPVDFGADPTGGSDSTASLQACINAAFTAGGKILVDQGTFLTSGVVIYSTQTIEFCPGGSFEMSAGGACIVTQVSPGAGPPHSTTISSVKIIKPNINLNSQVATGILLDCNAWSTIDTPNVTNVPSGNWSYTSGVGVITLPASAITILATPSAAFAYYNIIQTPNLINTASANNGVGIYFGDQSDTEGFPNVNRVIGGRVSNFVTGIYAYSGSDGLIDYTDVSHNTTGIQLGADTGPQINRFRVTHPYMEDCTNGIVVSIKASMCLLDGVASVSGTTNPLVFNSGSTRTNTYVLNWGQTYSGGGTLEGGYYQLSIDPAGFGGGLEIAVPAGAPPLLTFTGCQGPFSAKTATLSADVLGQISSLGYMPTGFNTSAQVAFTASQNWSNTQSGTDIIFFTTAKGATSPTMNLTVSKQGSVFNTGVGVFNVNPVMSQPVPTNNVSIGSAGSGAAVLVDTTFTGGEGSNAYTIGDIVKTLKNAGFITI